MGSRHGNGWWREDGLWEWNHITAGVHVASEVFYDIK